MTDLSALQAALTESARAAQAARNAVKDLVEERCADLCRDLRERREVAGYTQELVGDAIGLTRSQITNMEAGRGTSLQAVIAYAAFLGLRVALEPES